MTFIKGHSKSTPRQGHHHTLTGVATPWDLNDPVYPVNSCFTQIFEWRTNILCYNFSLRLHRIPWELTEFSTFAELSEYSRFSRFVATRINTLNTVVRCVGRHRKPHVNLLSILCAISTKSSLRIFHNFCTNVRLSIIEVERERAWRKFNELPRQQTFDVRRCAVQIKPIRPRLVLEVDVQKRRLGRPQTDVG